VIGDLLPELSVTLIMGCHALFPTFGGSYCGVSSVLAWEGRRCPIQVVLGRKFVFLVGDPGVDLGTHLHALSSARLVGVVVRGGFVHLYYEEVTI
jgi:hypothetical protein